MTPMSRSTRVRPAFHGRNGADSRIYGPVARTLLLFVPGMKAALLIGALGSTSGPGCVIPPELQPAGPDAGAGSKPIIVSASPPFAFPGPFEVARQDSPAMSLLAEDPDVGDSLFVRLYVDYNRTTPPLPQPALAECSAVPSGALQRIVPCSTTTLCNQITDEEDHVLEAMVADRSFLPGNHPDAILQPEFRAIETGGAFTVSSWVMTCAAPEPI